MSDFTAINLVEFAPSKLMRQGNKLEGVLLCGLKSKNGRVYSPAVLGKATGLYEGKPVYIDHTKGTPRSAGDRWGTVSNVSITPSGLRGDVDYLESHPMTERVLEQAEKGLGMFGMSHEARGTAKKDKGTGMEIVESIDDVAAIALVSEPATTTTLSEQVDTFPIDPEPVDLSEQVKTLTEQNTALREQNAAFLEQVKSLTEQIDSLNEQLGTLKDEIVRLNDLRWTKPRTASSGQNLTSEGFLKTILGKS